MKKGFTLVELLGVFAIMSLIVLLAVPTVTNLLKQSEKEQYTNFENNVFLAAEAYLSSNSDKYKELKVEGKTTYVTIKTLLSSDYLESTLINPKTGNNLYAIEEYNNVILVTLNEKKMWEYELYTAATDNEKNAITAYDALSKNATENEIDAIETQVDNLLNGKIKIALQNRLEYR